ncbi:hypothetical protein QTG54_010142 [Skeletonema marinoi]|uniref:SET domain-containing protein n=1 Tax=Skeletonema marinoi TaxID=267567 RepID=A0AAD8Y4U1_9STRA|nr:hypothetical protein QTG54_010142 [Skeletonema marinoi]
MSHRCNNSLVVVALAAWLMSPCASAFILTEPLPSASAHHRTIYHSSVDSIIDGPSNGNGDSTLTKICHILQNLQKDLLANPSKLQPILQQHQDSSADDVELSSKNVVKETLLSTRIPDLQLQLNRTRTGPSTIDGAGRGLFATEDIAKGELITCYPGDALLCEYSELEIDDEEEDGFDEEDIDFEDEDYYYYDEEADYVEEVVLWGEHVDTSDRLEEGGYLMELLQRMYHHSHHMQHQWMMCIL